MHNSDIESLYKYIYQKPNRAVWVEVLLWMNWMWVVPLGSGGCLSTWYWAAWPQSNPTSIKGLQLSNCKQRFSDQVFRHWRYCKHFESYHWLCQSLTVKSIKRIDISGQAIYLAILSRVEFDLLLKSIRIPSAIRRETARWWIQQIANPETVWCSDWK